MNLDFTAFEVIALVFSVLIVTQDRAEAIAGAIQGAGSQDLVLIAGKGHEDYQILGTQKVHFDDCEQALKALQDRVILSASN